ncbi:hypothetical protein FHW58_003372 [Duganella sp. 1224]|uniref:DUF2264 domain-containing protein n=1 Tax=Duganella sp. 1224 TaxID=2587052 RepID=UPI0015CC8F97|nr:DUF2264 domain-containing protein [Duganella sp. 1224]NYE62157.1 hypothetical protein [Duganella sp. 1224]
MRLSVLRHRGVYASVLVLCVAAAGYAVLVNRYHIPGWRQYRAPAAQERHPLAPPFLQDGPDTARYAALFSYFAQGFQDNATADYARIQYSGVGSYNGYAVTGLEGFSRTAPLLGAWLYGGRPARWPDADPARPDLVAMLRSGLLAGTAPGSASYWGDIGDYDQRVVEAADVARTLWLTRRQVWDQLSGAQRDQIAAWLQGALRVKVHPNNWQLFPVVTALALRQLGYPNVAVPSHHYQAFKQAYRGHGWFHDAPEGIDYYNAWGISYDLQWIQWLAPDYDPGFIGPALAQSADVVSHLLGPKGVTMMGRSTCYRTAIPAPVIARAVGSDDPQVAGLGRQALDVVWRHFVSHGALQDGHLTQGYYGTDLRLVEPYIGPGSCHWGLRSLVLAFMQPDSAPFWTAPRQPLPVEQGDYTLALPELGWTLHGERASGVITLEIAANNTPHYPLAAYGWRQRLDEAVTLRPRRPANHEAKYLQRYYRNAPPYMAVDG